MFITNFCNLNLKNKHKYYECDSVTANWLIQKGFPLLSFNNGIYFFVLTEELSNCLQKGSEKT